MLLSPSAVRKTSPRSSDKEDSNGASWWDSGLTLYLHVQQCTYRHGVCQIHTQYTFSTCVVTITPQKSSYLTLNIFQLSVLFTKCCQAADSWFHRKQVLRAKIKSQWWISILSNFLQFSRNLVWMSENIQHFQHSNKAEWFGKVEISAHLLLIYVTQGSELKKAGDYQYRLQQLSYWSESKFVIKVKRNIM